MQETNAIVQAIPELEGEVPAAQFAEGHALLAWCLVISLALAALAVILWIRRSKREERPLPTPLDTALAGLRELEETLPPIRACSLQISLILRQYLQGQVQDPALYETHEEFSQRLDALSTVPETCRYDTRYLLEKLADLKYAGHRQQDLTLARTLIEQARALLIRIHDEQQALATPDSKTLS